MNAACKPPPSRRHLMQQMGAAASAALLLPLIPLARADQLRTLRAGVLRVGTYFVNPPFEFISGGKRVGFEVDLMEEIARRLDLHSEFVNTRWEVILHDMEENRYDCIVGGITITPDRQRLLAWSVPYLTTTLSLIVDLRRSPANMTLADLKGGTVGVQAATTDYDVAVAMQRAGQIGSVKVYPFAKIGDAIKDLSSGRVDAVMKVYPVAAWFVRRHARLAHPGAGARRATAAGNWFQSEQYQPRRRGGSCFDQNAARQKLPSARTALERDIAQA